MFLSVCMARDAITNLSGGVGGYCEPHNHDDAHRLFSYPMKTTAKDIDAVYFVGRL